MKNKIVTFIIISFVIFGTYTYKIMNPKALNTIKTDTQKKITSTDLKQKQIDILTDSIKELGQIKVLETVERVPYSDIQQDKVLGITYKTRWIIADTYYKVDWTYDLSNIQVTKNNDIFIITLKDEMEITVSYDVQKSNLQSDTSPFAKEYSAEEVNALISALQDKVAEKVQVDGNMYDKAYTSLEGQIRGITEKLGLKNVIIEFEGV